MQIDRSRGARAALAALLVLGLWAALPGSAHGLQPDDAATPPYPDIQFILSSFSFLVWGALVMWMCAGFTMLESGSVRTKNASMICLKNVGIYSIAGLSYYFVGYGLMYVDVEGFIGTLQIFRGPTGAERALLDGATDRTGEVVGLGNSTMSALFFQTLFVATTASIVSGAILERVKLWAFWAFTVILTALIYPIAGSWVWGGGWLDEMGFQDFAGSTVVHTTGGCAAFAALLIIGPRRGKFRPDGSVKATPPSNVLVATLGVLILWLGWFGFNGGSQLALATPTDAVAMSSVLFNTNLAAASGLVAAVIVARPIFGRLGVASSLNGALAGLVSITAGPNIADSWWAVIIGAVGGLLCSVATKLMERMKLDDAVGAIPVHLVAGVWGTLAASLAAGADLGVQLVGVASVAAFAFIASLIVWTLINRTMGIRVSRDVEYVGQDVGELGIESHPEFVLVPEDFEDYQRPLRSRDRDRLRRVRRAGPERQASPVGRPIDPPLWPGPGPAGPPDAGTPGPYSPPLAPRPVRPGAPRPVRRGAPQPVPPGAAPPGRYPRPGGAPGGPYDQSGAVLPGRYPRPHAPQPVQPGGAPGGPYDQSGAVLPGRYPRPDAPQPVQPGGVPAGPYDQPGGVPAGPSDQPGEDPPGPYPSPGEDPPRRRG